MSKSFRDEELFLVLSRQGYTILLAVTLRITSQINRNIKHCATHGAHQLALRVLFLKVQATQHTLCGHGLIILYKMNVDASFLHVFFVVGQTKLEGELAVSQTLEKYFIVRIAWVFGLNGKNFIKTILSSIIFSCTVSSFPLQLYPSCISRR